MHEYKEHINVRILDASGIIPQNVDFGADNGPSLPEEQGQYHKNG